MMVDINCQYLPNSDIESQNRQTLSTNTFDNIFDEIDCLENIDENYFLNLTNCDELSQYNFDQLPDTPPETPINYNISSNNSPNAYVSNLDSPSLSPISRQDNVQSDSISDNGLYGSTTSSVGLINTNQNLILTQTSLLPNVTTNNNAAVRSNSLLIQSPIQATDLNGYKLNSNPLVFAKPIESNFSTKINKTKQKAILPNSILTTKTANDNSKLTSIQRLEARKLRNRQAALNSRMKQKDYVDSLEANVQKLTKERDTLLAENKLLRQKLTDMEIQLCNRMKIDINGNYESNKKAKISLFAILFLVCFQVSPYLISMAPNNQNSDHLQRFPTVSKSSNMHTKVGRSLLWNTNSNGISSDYYDPYNGDKPSRDFNSSATVYANKSILCQDYFNQTESLRLENELRDLLTRFKLEDKRWSQSLKSKDFKPIQDVRLKQVNNKRLLLDSKYVPIPRLKLWMQKQKYDHYLQDEFEPSPRGSQNYQSLLDTVHRRDDTFYYLSYPSKGHLILPPISNRTDVRPRFSFLIPSFHNLSLEEAEKSGNTNLNHSISSQMFLLQIDCQVINTKVIMINDENRFGNKTKSVTGKERQFSKSASNKKNHRKK